MRKKLERNEMAQRLVEVTLQIIEENGGLQGVNLRQIARRAECAHTNIYNYYQDFNDLLWDVFTRIGNIWWKSFSEQIKPGMPLEDLMTQITALQIDFALTHTGWYRCLWSEPLEGNPPDAIMSERRKQRDAITQLLLETYPELDQAFANDIFMILFSYGHGAISLMINGRIYRATLPEYKDQMIKNTLLLMHALVNQYDK